MDRRSRAGRGHWDRGKPPRASFGYSRWPCHAVSRFRCGHGIGLAAGNRAPSPHVIGGAARFRFQGSTRSCCVHVYRNSDNKP